MTTPAELEQLAEFEREEREEDDARREANEWHEWLAETRLLPVKIRGGMSRTDCRSVQPADPREGLRMLGIDYDHYLSWDGQRERMAEADRPQAERDAGVWALDKLQSCLGDSWMTRVGKKNPAAVDRLLLASSHAVAYAELLDLALRLQLLAEVAGTASVLRDSRRDLTEDRRLHTRVVLEVAALGLQHERQVALEQSVAPGLRPTDIVLDGPSGPLVVEAVVISAAEVMRKGMNYSDALSGGLRRICRAHGVEVDGSLDEILGPKQTAEWLGRVEALAQQVGGDGRERALGSEAGSLVVVPNGARPTSFKGPVIEGQGFSRIARKIADKAVQASEARATWLRVDVLDGLWQVTPWSTYPWPPRGERLARKFGVLWLRQRGFTASSSRRGRLKDRDCSVGRAPPCRMAVTRSGAASVLAYAKR